MGSRGKEVGMESKEEKKRYNKEKVNGRLLSGILRVDYVLCPDSVGLFGLFFSLHVDSQT